MKALILNSGLGSRMGDVTSSIPKCMVQISSQETILSRQLKLLLSLGIEDIVITTGYLEKVLIDYVKSLDLPLNITFVTNPEYESTNYIYSIYLAREYLQEDIIMMHGDIVFDAYVLDKIIQSPRSSMIVSSILPLSSRDFKACIDNDRIKGVGVEFFDHSLAAQPLYKLNKEDWLTWLDGISLYCENGQRTCYAEKAFNECSNNIDLYPLDIKDLLCSEIDTAQDLDIIHNKLLDISTKTVYMCFSTDILHSGHISIIRKASNLGRLIIGVLSDEATISYKRFPLLPYSERKVMFENIAGVYKVVEQKTLSYKENLNKYKPTYLVHGDDWKEGFQKPIRNEAIEVLSSYGGILVEFPYAKKDFYKDLENRSRIDLSLPDSRRSRLKKSLSMKGTITAIEAHNGITGLIAEKTVVYQDGAAYQFDAIWISSLCDSISKGKPDIELVDMSSRFRTIDDIMEISTKPIIFDGDTGGLTEHFVYTVRTLERMGVSMVIIEDKTGLKKNSLFGTEVKQVQESIENFSAKITAGKKAQKTKDFMICARIESLILERGINDALDRAFAFVKAGADAIMIHSRKKDPDEIFEFVEKFRDKDKQTPIVVVPTSFNTVTEEEFRARGVNIIIYANQLIRTGFPAMQEAARSILSHHRAKECDDRCMPIKEIITLIPDDLY